MKLQYDEPLSNFAFKLYLRRYNAGSVQIVPFHPAAAFGASDDEEDEDEEVGGGGGGAGADEDGEDASGVMEAADPPDPADYTARSPYPVGRCRLTPGVDPRLTPG